eukprot:1557068-Amphidinium_carterae.1
MRSVARRRLVACPLALVLPFQVGYMPANLYAASAGPEAAMTCPTVDQWHQHFTRILDFPMGVVSRDDCLSEHVHKVLETASSRLCSQYTNLQKTTNHKDQEEDK